MPVSENLQTSPPPTEADSGLSLEELECVGPIHILVVDDDEMTCRVIRDALAHKDFEIRTINDHAGVEAAIRDQPAHLVVLDYVLPGLSIEQVLTWLHDYQPGAEVIVITGYPTVEGAQTALRARVYDYITKPFQLAQLRQTVIKCLEARGLLRMSVTALREAVGAAIRERRKALNLTLSEMVKRTSLSLGYLSQIELGKNSASIETLYRISLALGVRLSELFQTVQRNKP
jgi:CheY-like chemotaxis protein